MKLKKFLLLLVVIACLPAFCLAAGTATITMTATETQTWTITQTPTITSTITPTATITCTFTNSPTPQADVYAYPNPAVKRNSMFIAYPSKYCTSTMPCSLPGDNKFKRVIITIYGANGDFVNRITDDFPNGFTEFDITKMARGTYIYKVMVRYQNDTEDLYKYKRFAIIK